MPTNDRKTPEPPKHHADHAEAHTPELPKAAPVPVKVKAPLDCPKEGCDQMMNHAGPHGPKK